MTDWLDEIEGRIKDGLPEQLRLDRIMKVIIEYERAYTDIPRLLRVARAAVIFLKDHDTDYRVTEAERAAHLSAKRGLEADLRGEDK